MRDPKRIDRIINKIRAYWLANPDLRFLQMVDSISYQVKLQGQDIFYTEDDQFETLLDLTLQVQKGKQNEDDH